MPKALQGAALIGIDAALVAGAAFTGGADFAVAFMATKLFATIAVAGVAMEAGAIASALTQNRGMGLTIRQPAANRNFVYGMQRVGGTAIFESTTGSGPAQRNYVIVLADHPCEAIVNLYLDGRQVFFDPGSFGNTTRNGINFGGNADGSDHVDEGGNRYNFGGPLVFCEARYGDQLPGDVMSSLTANDGRWVQTAGGSPFVGGCTYVYLKIEADANMFPSDPEIRFTIKGKNDIFDPRTGTTGYTENWGLIVSDALQNVEFGVGEARANINTAQLIAAANVADEQIFSPNAGATESRYTINGEWDSGVSPGDLLATMMTAAQGRLSYIGGEWYIFPAVWQGPSFTFGEGDILKDFTWTTARKIRERYNSVRGTFIAPRFPFAVAGNLYDSNGFGPDGTRANLFGLEWMPESYPDYAQDALHGYSSDRWLTEDQGIERILSLNHKCVISLATAQRLAKIALLRNRLSGGTTTLTMSLAAYQAIPTDVIQLNFAPRGWVNKLFEITGVQFRTERVDNGPGMTMVVDLTVQETDPSIYEWDPNTEELTINDTPAISGSTNITQTYVVTAPTGVNASDSFATAVTTPDGVTRPRIALSWTAAADGFVSQYQTQVQPVGSTTWIDAGLTDAANSSTFINNVVSGQSYNIRVRALRPKGAASAWVTLSGHTVAPAFSQINSLGLAAGVNPNAPNNATVDSILGSPATVRVYGPGGVGTSFTQFVGSTALTLPSANFTGQALSATLSLFWNTATSTYSINTTATAPSDSSIFIGTVKTVSSAGTGGVSGGGGRFLA